ncbi:hypothetical protein CEXT_338631 [Caerostris extrusa]|uniref:Uncharacterized protein n=1 Tax=Caerostris extrusa TaxID=172846 RepID=A0AAV4S9H5_CAEEX|nr:hypothetical protein CEXT_338631 [Caerostris extrusa]
MKKRAPVLLKGELPQFVTTEELAAPIAGPTPQSSSTANNSRLKDFRKYVIAASMGHLSNIPANALEANEKANNPIPLAHGTQNRRGFSQSPVGVPANRSQEGGLLRERACYSALVSSEHKHKRHPRRFSSVKSSFTSRTSCESGTGEPSRDPAITPSPSQPFSCGRIAEQFQLTWDRFVPVLSNK